MDFDTEVLVVGAGPTGLVLAARLAAFGVRCRIIDMEPERSPYSRALVVQPRSLEQLAPMGVCEALTAEGRGVREVRIFVHREEAVRLGIGDIGVDDTAWARPLFVSQAVTERVLDAHLEGLGLTVERPLALLGATQDADGVTATIAGPDGTFELRCRWLVGCDGAHSVVRKEAGLRFDGDAYPQDFILADLRVDWDIPEDVLNLFLRRDGIFAVFPAFEAHTLRLIASRSGDVEADPAPPTLEEFQAIADEVSPVPMRLSDPVWLARFRLHHRGVDRYRVGRMFVAGDAAHIHSPAGGQGMNTGIQDAVNLAWKLAMVSRGRCDEGLLDSYHAERFPVGQRLLNFTDRLFRLGSSSNSLIAALRSFLVPRLAPVMLDDRARRATAFRFVSQLGIRYRKSPIVTPYEGDASAAFRAGPRAGDRAPDGALKDPDTGRDATLHGRFDGLAHEWLLFTGRDTAASAVEKADRQLASVVQRFGGLVRSHVILGRLRTDHRVEALFDERGDVHARYGMDGPGMVLVRPDGYIATRCPGLETWPIERVLEGLFR